MQRLLLNVSKFASEIAAILMVVLTVLYANANPFATKMDSWLSHRLEISAKAFDQYGVHFFGIDVAENGFGGNTSFSAEYFFIDSSYIRILIEFGIFVFIVTLIGWTICAKKAYVKNRNMLLVMLIIAAIQAIMEHHIYEIEYNVFLLLPFATIIDGKYVEEQNVS